MQRYKLEKRFKKKGWWLLRHGGNHDIWTNGVIEVSIPRHADVKENLAKALIKKYNL